MNLLSDRAADSSIKAPTLNLTLISGATLAVGSIVTYWADFYKVLFGYEPVEHPGPAAAIFVAVVLAIGFIYGADLIARGLASSRGSDVVAMPKGWTATLNKRDADDEGYSVAALRTTGDSVEYFVAKEGTASWRLPGTSNGTIKLIPPAT